MKPLSLSAVWVLMAGILFLASARADTASPTLEFFLRKDLTPAVGWNCGSEEECFTKCGGTDACTKPIGTCLNCVGARSPYLMDFFQNAGDTMVSCPSQAFPAADAEEIFRSVDLVPVWSLSPYNPLGILDLQLILRFQSLCPGGSGEAIAMAFANRKTHAIWEIPFVKCGKMILPLKRLTEDCVQKTDRATDFIRKSSELRQSLETSFQEALAAQDGLAVFYDTVPYSEYVEAQYLRCGENARAVCQKLCTSNLSCSFPLQGERNGKAIGNFNQGKWNTCNVERFSLRTLMRYLGSKTGFAFSPLSLEQVYDLPSDTGGFGDFSVINRILGHFTGVFQLTGQWKDRDYSSFLVSPAYRGKIREKMNALCSNDGSSAFVLGRGETIERVFCRSAQGSGYFQTLALESENCQEKAERLSSAGGDTP